MLKSNTYSLDGTWQFRQAGNQDWLPALVPGNVHTDLLAAGLIPDPFVGDNELKVQWVATTDWEYRRTFTPDPNVLAQSKIFLVCDGLDTLADVWLNGALVGQSQNMFYAHRWEVKEHLRPGENELVILFHAPVSFITEAESRRHLTTVGETMPGSSNIRKAPCHFGWDWGPKLPTSGIWQSIRLEGYDIARLEDVHVRQHHANGQVSVSVASHASTWKDAALQVDLTLTAPDGASQSAQATLKDGQVDLSLIVNNPQLWWPNDLGAQPLYQLTVTLKSGEALLDQWHYQLGLRTLELRQDLDQWGRSFTFFVNGVSIFAKGADWIPSDSFPARITPQHLEHLIASAAACHQNMLRIWGGGYYEVETFYDLCDKYGILVWQDFMFSCSVYPMDTEAFLDNVRVEVRENVRRLRHRACLALWCGNNEMEVGWAGWGWDKPETQSLRTGYVRFFHDLLPAWVAADDPDLPYWPSSPSSGLPIEIPNSDSLGDTHLWNVWHALKPFEEYRTHHSRFVSEFGFQSLPALATVATYAEPLHHNMTSYIMEHHQRNRGGNGRIIGYLTDHFRLPKDFDFLVYLTQTLQAEAMRVGVEHWRRHRGRCSGALYWQLNDTWPVASWASLDYFGRWKALQYASKRFFAPVALSIFDERDQCDIYVVNDTVSDWVGEVRWSLETLTGQVIAHAVEAVAAPALASSRILQLDSAPHWVSQNRQEVVLVSELWQNNTRLAMHVTPFIPNKHLNLTDPNLKFELTEKNGQLTLRLSAQSLARFIEIAFSGADVIFSDNHFDLPAGRTLEITCALPSGWTLAQAQAALHIRSLSDTY
jgi:beta-mannosidase